MACDPNKRRLLMQGHATNEVNYFIDATCKPSRIAHSTFSSHHNDAALQIWQKCRGFSNAQLQY